MYTEHFGLKKLPFENVPDPSFFFEEGDYARIHKRITDSLNAGRGLMVVTGPIGSGKTTQSQIIISDFSKDIKLIWMAEPPANSTDLFMFIAQELGLKTTTSGKAFLLRDIRDALSKINSEGNKCLVIVDESHLMSDDTVNGVRLLNNLEEGSAKLIQMLLLGQDELLEMINRPDLEHFKQRIATLEILGRMDSERVKHYIAHRIKVAGGDPAIIADTGWEALVLASGTGGGIPRVVNLLCDKSLHAAFEKEKTSVDVDDVYEAAEGIGLSKDVFHYKIALKNKEKDKETQPVPETAQVKEPETTYNKPARPFFSEPEIEQESLKKPVIFLSLSIAVFIFSISFYCSRSDSSSLVSCLFELIGF